MSPINRVVNALSLGGNQQIVGSYAQTSLFPADAEIFESVNIGKSPEDAALEGAHRLQQAVRKVVNPIATRIINVKLGGTAAEGHHFSARQILAMDPHVLASVINSPGKLKVDVAVWEGSIARWVEVASLITVLSRGVPLNFSPR